VLRVTSAVAGRVCGPRTVTSVTGRACLDPGGRVTGPGHDPTGVPLHVLARHIGMGANGAGWGQPPGASRIHGFPQVAG
jgi:hypothetical protein